MTKCFCVISEFLTCFLFCSVAVAETVSGQYVHVVIPGDSGTLSLAEVEVFSGGNNIALKKNTVQSSTAWGGDSGRAVDGNTDGNWGKNSITHTAENVKEPQWEVDLGSVVPIEKILIWNRDGFESRLNGCRVMVLDAGRKVVWGIDPGNPGKGATTMEIKTTPPFKQLGKTIPKIVESAQQSRPDNNRNDPGRGTPESLRMAIQDLIATYGDRYPKGKEFLSRLDAMDAEKDKEGFEKLKREALLANPLLDFNKLLLIRRKGPDGLPANWQGNSSLDRGKTKDGATGKEKFKYDNEIAIMTSLDDGEIMPLYRSENGSFVGDVDLHFGGDRMLFSALSDNKSWGIFEIKVDGTGLRRVSPDMGDDVDSYDPIYLPDDRVIFDCSSGYAGVPCVGGSDYVANLHIMNLDGTGVRRLCFEQDNDWYPVMMENGRIMYLRWEYTDSAHYFSRVLMHMNPDGTDQKAFYGSNSYWPNSLFYARPIPGSSSKFVGIVSGHHGTRRAGGLFLFDGAKGRFEADGVVQQIPGRGKKVEALVLDGLASSYSPHFLHPYPLNDKYFIVSCNDGGWGIWLVDVFDNMLLLKKESGAMLLEPLPLRKTKTPSILPDRIRPGEKEAMVLITDIYEGPGLEGVPRGEVKALRIYKYEYSPRHRGGHYAMGLEACWDVHNILGTVPVEEDGSTTFKIPANTPVSIQPLDKYGKALQLMRSWLVGMSGEMLSCVGCHENQNSAPPMKRTIASRKPPYDIKPWNGPARGFAFDREIQPVIDKYCVGCHDGKPPDGRYEIMDRVIGTGNDEGKKFSEKGIPDFSDPKKARRNIHPYVRRNGPEGDYHLLTPLEFHAETSELIQMLRKGHHNVKMDASAWDRLYTWIDLNVPEIGSWGEAGADKKILARRLELRKLYAGVDADAEGIINPYSKTETFIKPAELKRNVRDVKIAGWPFNVEAAKNKQGTSSVYDIDIGNDQKIRLVRIPAGEFPMGSNSETPVEQPLEKVNIDKPFWMGSTEITLGQYRQFDPEYMNGVYDMHYKDQVKRGYYMNEPEFPVIRVSWNKAMEFCKWLSMKSGKKVSLPTEAQWEWACRAGTDTPMNFGGFDDDFSIYANMADAKVIEMAVSGVDPKPIKNPDKNMDFELKDPRFNDGVLHLAKAGSYKPNVWGLYDMHGNVVEWTRSRYSAYPYKDNDGRNDVSKEGKRVVRGGSWHDRQYRSTSSYRLGFPEWQRVYHAGFRIVVEE